MCMRAYPSSHDWTLLTTCEQSASYSSTAGALHTPIAGPSYASAATGGRPSDTGLVDPHQQARAVASPRSTSSSAGSHGHAYAPAMVTSATAYSPIHGGAVSAGGTTGLGIGPSAGAPPDLRLTSVPSVPGPGHQQTTSWHQPQGTYSSDLSATGSMAANRASWDFNSSYLGSSPATGLPSSVHAFQYQQHTPQAVQTPQQQRYPSLTSISQSGLMPMSTPVEAHRFVPLQGYDEHHHPSQPTSTAQ
jgi:hypothetical protein